MKMPVRYNRYSTRRCSGTKRYSGTKKYNGTYRKKQNKILKAKQKAYTYFCKLIVKKEHLNKHGHVSTDYTKSYKYIKNLVQFFAWRKHYETIHDKLLYKTIRKRGKSFHLRLRYYPLMFYKKVNEINFFRLRFLFSKNNLFFVGTTYFNNLIFWYTSKQYDYKQYNLKSPFVLELFYERLEYELKKNRMQYFLLEIYGKHKALKKYLKTLCYTNKFKVIKISRKLFVAHNGCKKKHVIRK
jgi:hypothetical protein